MVISPNMVKISSWNVYGLGSYVKRQKVLNYLKQRDSDIVLLQETHLLEKDTLRLHDRWIKCAYHNDFTQKKARCIYIILKTNVTVEREYRDKEGRMLILLANLAGQNVILGNLYAPNIEDPVFFLQFKKIILDFGNFPVILGGDYNQVLDVFLDRSSHGITRTSKTQEAIKSLCKDTGLHDVWRLLNPDA